MGGLTPTGFVVETREEIVEALNAVFKAEYGDQFDVSSSSPDGQIIGITADIASKHSFAMADIVNSQIPSRARGASLDSVVEWNGIQRIVDRPTAVSLSLAGVSGTAIPAGHVFRNGGNDFATAFDATLPAGGVEVVVTVNCLTLGEIYVPANGAWTQPTNPISGVTSITNDAEGITGIVRETDPQLRSRREVNTISRGTSNYDAIYEAVASLNLEYIYILENDETTEVDGQPANSFQVIVEGGTPSEIADIIFVNKPAGIKAFGTTVLPVTDTKGVVHNVGLTRPTRTPVACTFTIEREVGSSNDVVEQMKQTIMDYINSLAISDNVVWSTLATPIILNVDNVRVVSWTTGEKSGVQGVADVAISVSQRAQVESIDDITIVEV